MKKVVFAVLVAVLSLSMMVSAFAAEALKVEVKDGNVVITVDPAGTEQGSFDANDWIGIYPADKESYNDSSLWWYLPDEAATWTLPADKAVSDRIADLIDENDQLIPGSYKAILLDNDSYDPIDGMEPVYFEVTEPAQPVTAETTDVPDDPAPGTVDIPQTGDFAVSLFAVTAVLAMGALVVFAKKRSF